jgi:hypothetical protein
MRKSAATKKPIGYLAPMGFSTLAVQIKKRIKNTS